jgi:hypothetical protein
MPILNAESKDFFASLIIQPVQQTLLMHHTPIASVWCILQVIPFTPSAGVLEWVDGTVPLLEYLLGRFVECGVNPPVASFLSTQHLQMGF